MTQCPDAKISALYKQYDTNKDGRISPKEMKAMLSDLEVELDYEEFDLLFDQFDDDGNGSLDAQEFRHFVYVALNCDFYSVSSMLFYISDYDHNNSIDRSELKKLMLKMGYSLTEAEINQLMAQVGTRSRMNYAQFCEFIRIAGE